MRLPFLPLAICLAAPLHAATVRDCDTWEAGARNLIFPPEENIRSFANGAISLIGLDTGGEPVCCSAHILVLYPEPDGLYQSCALVSREGPDGWTWVDVGRASAAYDPARGLTVMVPTQVYNGAGSDPSQVTITITINQSSGLVTAD